MGSMISVAALMAGNGDKIGEWGETETGYVLLVVLPWLKKGNAINADVVKGDGDVMRLRISGKKQDNISGRTVTFNKYKNLPKTSGISHDPSVVIHNGSIVVTLPKVEQV